MAAGSMLQTGLGKTQGLRAGVLWGAGLARRSLGQQTQPSAEPEGPPLFLASKCNLLAGIHSGVVWEIAKPHPQPIPQSVHHHSISSSENRYNPRCAHPAPSTCGMGERDRGCVFSSLGCRRCVRREKGRARCERTVPADGGRG